MPATDDDAALLRATVEEAMAWAGTSEVSVALGGNGGSQINLTMGPYLLTVDPRTVHVDQARRGPPPFTPTRLLDLGEVQERRLLEGALQRLAGLVGTRVAPNTIDLRAVPLPSVRGLRRYLTEVVRLVEDR